MNAGLFVILWVVSVIHTFSWLQWVPNLFNFLYVQTYRGRNDFLGGNCEMCLHLTLIIFPCSVKQHIVNTMFSGINMTVCMVYNWLKKKGKKKNE